MPGSVGAVINGIPTFVGVTTNAGSATFKGIEAEASATLAREFGGAGSRLDLSGTLGYIDAQYDEFITNVANFSAAGAPTPGSRAQPADVAASRRIQNIPKWTASGTLDLSLPIGGGDLSAAATYSYRSKTFQFETPSPLLDQAAYSLVDANLVYSFADDRFTIGVHGKNLFDKQYNTSGYQFLNVNPVTGAYVLSVTPKSPSFAQARVEGTAPPPPVREVARTLAGQIELLVPGVRRGGKLDAGLWRGVLAATAAATQFRSGSDRDIAILRRYPAHWRCRGRAARRLAGR